MSRLTRDGTAEPVSRDQILRHARGQGNIHFPCSADHEQDWQPYPVDPYSAICDDHTYIHTYIFHLFLVCCMVTHNILLTAFCESSPQVARVCNISAAVLCQGSRTLHAGICFSAGWYYCSLIDLFCGLCGASCLFFVCVCFSFGVYC